jgi:hypothetical protein
MKLKVLEIPYDSRGRYDWNKVIKMYDELETGKAIEVSDINIQSFMTMAKYKNKFDIVKRFKDTVILMKNN